MTTFLTTSRSDSLFDLEAGVDQLAAELLSEVLGEDLRTGGPITRLPKGLLAERTRDYQAWVEAYRAQPQDPIEWAEKRRGWYTCRARCDPRKGSTCST